MSDVLTRNNVKVFGSGTQPMMFAHGFGCDQNMWRYVTPAFEKDYRIVLFDYVGSGKSELASYDPRRYSSLDGYADDILEICRALDLREVILVGHSVSGMVAVLAANPDRPELGAELTESFCSTDPVIARRFAEATFFADNRDDLQRLRVPALVLQCSEDIIAPTHVGEYVHQRAAGSTFRQLRATGHCPHLSHPEETIEAIREYLASSPAA